MFAVVIILAFLSDLCGREEQSLSYADNNIFLSDLCGREVRNAQNRS